MGDETTRTSDTDLTAEESAAIASLQQLARRWPASLTLASWSGSLVVLHSADIDRVMNGTGAEQDGLILAHVLGIPNDGGDP